jgi:hypothetical protein
VVSAHASPKDETGLALGDRGQGVEQVAGRAGQSAEVRYHQDVTGLQLVEQLAELDAVGLGTARHLAEHLFASGLGQLAHRGVNALAVRRYPGVALFHGFILHRRYEPEKSWLSAL